MTLYDLMIERAEDMERVAVKSLRCSPSGATMIGCSEYYRRCAEEIKAWAREICMDCGAKEVEK